MRMGEKHEPTALTRNLVETHTAVGTRQEIIASIMGISPDTLQKYYRKELDEALAKANASIGGVLFKKAMSGDNASMMFWLKTRANGARRIASSTPASMAARFRCCSWTRNA